MRAKVATIFVRCKFSRHLFAKGGAVEVVRDLFSRLEVEACALVQAEEKIHAMDCISDGAFHAGVDCGPDGECVVFGTGEGDETLVASGERCIIGSGWEVGMAR